jgi:hypothetical protein
MDFSGARGGQASPSPPLRHNTQRWGGNVTAILISHVLENVPSMAHWGARMRVEPLHFYRMVACG